MAQGLPEVFVGETRLLGTLCAFGTAWPFPLLGLCFPPARGWQSWVRDRKAHSCGAGSDLCAGMSISATALGLGATGQGNGHFLLH